MKYFISIFIFTLHAFLLMAQDTIVLQNGKKLLAMHVRIREKIYYKHYEEYPHRRDSINKLEVSYVVYSSGRKIGMVLAPWHSPVIISPGIGLSAIQYQFKDPIKDTGANIISFSPVYSLNIDYAPAEKLSIGIGAAYQYLTMNPYVKHTYSYLTGYSTITAPNGTVYYWPGQYQSFTTGGADQSINERLTRLNIGVRLLWHIRNDSTIDFYVGTRIGISFWTDHTDPSGFNSQAQLTKPSIQAIIGERRDITNHIGIHLEGGVGSPYFCEVGVYLKFNTLKK